MFGLGKWVLSGLTFGLLLVAQANAGVGFQPVSSEELKMTSEPLAPGAAAIILYREVDRDDNIHTPHEDNYIRMKILTAEGRKYADVEIPFFKENEDIVSVHARTIRPDGSIADFGGKVFEKYLMKGKFAGNQVRYLAKTFTLSDVQVGSIIEYSFTRDFREYFLYDSHWFLSDELFTKKAGFTLKPFSDSYYGTRTLRWSWNFLPAGSSPPKEGPDKIVRLEASNIPAFPVEEYMPPADELKSRVDFMYEEGIVETEQTNFWKHVGKNRNGEMEGIVGKRKAMEEAVGQIVSPSDTPEVKLRKIYDRVQKMRNTSFEVEKTEQEQKRAKEKTSENVNVEQIWKRGYGNGRQLTWLFLGMARAAGFEAYGCLVSDRKHYFFTPSTMQSNKLNENVVLVKVNGKDLYLDPGAAFTPYGLLTWSETGVPGLRLDKDGGTWINTTLPEPSASRIERVGKLKLSETGDLKGKLTLTYTGLEAMDYRLDQMHSDEVERKKFLEERLTSQIGMASEAELTNKPDWSSSDAPLVAEFDLTIPGWASNAGKRALLPAAIFTAAEKNMFEHANRVQPIYFEYPHEKVDDITVELPPGWQVSSVPAAQTKDGHIIVYSLKVDQGPGTLHLTRSLSMNILQLDAKYYPALRQFFDVVRSHDSEQIVVRPGEIHASN